MTCPTVLWKKQKKKERQKNRMKNLFKDQCVKSFIKIVVLENVRTFNNVKWPAGYISFITLFSKSLCNVFDSIHFGDNTVTSCACLQQRFTLFLTFSHHVGRN